MYAESWDSDGVTIYIAPFANPCDIRIKEYYTFGEVSVIVLQEGLNSLLQLLSSGRIFMRPVQFYFSLWYCARVSNSACSKYATSAGFRV